MTPPIWNDYVIDFEKPEDTECRHLQILSEGSHHKLTATVSTTALKN